MYDVIFHMQMNVHIELVEIKYEIKSVVFAKW